MSRKSFRKKKKANFFKKGRKKKSVYKSKTRLQSKETLPDNLRALQMFGIPYEFHSKGPEDKEPCEKDFENRKDLRNFPFVTIDGVTAKDFDDSIYVKEDKKGWRVFVSIADVSFYIKENTDLDREAYLRGNSTYFPGFVAPMLPHYISQGLCSLNPKKNRLSMTVEMVFDTKGRIKKTDFYESVIQSQARLTYEKAQKIIEGKNVESSQIQKSIISAARLAQVLMDRRFSRGALNLDLPETEVILDSKGSPVDIVQQSRLFSHKLIEELMLSCNLAVAHFLKQKKQTFIYRIHEPPFKKDLSHLDQLLKAMDPEIQLLGKESFFKKKKSSAQKLSSLIEKTKNHPKKEIMHFMVLRALSQARYSAYNKGHFGLQFENYAHFTSPIRRYSDLIVHRILKKVLKLEKKGRGASVKEMEKKAHFLSECESRSVKAERYLESVQKAQFMSQYEGRKFSGVISSVVKFGFFVTLEEYNVDGLVHLNNLGGRWKFHPVKLFLKEVFSEEEFQQGDEVLIQVRGVNVEEGQVDFNLIEHNHKKFIPKKQKKFSFRKKKYFRRRRR